MIAHRAAWVLPIEAPPIRDGWVAVHDGRIVALGGPSEPQPGPPIDPTQPVEPFVILPALVNAHVHLELSWMRGLVPRASSLPLWAARVIELRGRRGDDRGPIERAIGDARAFGTSLVGEVTNTLATYSVLSESSLSAAIFYEQLGFAIGDGEAQVREATDHVSTLPPDRRLRVSIVPHAPYSVSVPLLRAIAALERGVVSTHLGESVEERQFLADGTGAWRTLLERLEAWDGTWMVPRCGPVEYIARAGLLTERLVAVHGVQLTDDELGRLTAARATLVTCPRSNAWTGAGAPPIARFYESGVRVAIGTDSLASVDDLNVFSELAAMRLAAPRVPAARLLESATRIGAEALGFGSELGTIAPGKRGELLAVRVPEGVEDVEEYLVGGVRAEDISWLHPG